MVLKKNKKELELEQLLKLEDEGTPDGLYKMFDKERYDKLIKEVFKLDKEYEVMIDNITVEEIANTKILTTIPVNKLNGRTDFYELLKLTPGFEKGEAFLKLSKKQIINQAIKWAKLLSLEYPFLVDFQQFTTECIDIRIMPRGVFKGGYVDDFNIWKIDRNGFRKLVDILDKYGNKNYCFFTSVYCIERDKEDDKPNTVKRDNAKYTQKITLDMDRISLEEYYKYKEILVKADIEPSLTLASGFGFQVRLFLNEKCYDKEALKKVNYTLAMKGIRLDLSMDNASKIDRTYPSFNNKLFDMKFKETLVDKLGLAKKVQPIPTQIIHYSDKRYTLEEILEKIEQMPEPSLVELKQLYDDKEIERVKNYLGIMKEQLDSNAISIEEINSNLDILVEKKIKALLQRNQGKIVLLNNKKDLDSGNSKYDTKEEVSQKIKEGKHFNYKKLGNKRDQPIVIQLNREEEREPLNKEQLQELQQHYGEVKGLDLYKLPIAVQYSLLGADKKRWHTFLALVPFFQNCYFIFIQKQNFSQEQLLMKIQEIMRIWNSRCGKYENNQRVDKEVKRLFYKNIRTSNTNWGNWNEISCLFGARKIPAELFDTSKTKLVLRTSEDIIIPNPIYKNLKFLPGEEVKIYIVMAISLAKEQLTEWAMKDYIEVFKLSEKTIRKYLKNLIELNLIEEVPIKGRKKVYKITRFRVDELIEMGYSRYPVGNIEMIITKARISAHIRIYLALAYFSELNFDGERWEGYHEAIGNLLGFEECTISRYTEEMKKLGMFKKITYYNDLDIPVECDYLLYYRTNKKRD